MKNPCEDCKDGFEMQEKSACDGNPYSQCLCVPRLQYLQEQKQPGTLEEPARDGARKDKQE